MYVYAPIKLLVAVMLMAIALVSFISAPGIQPGFGLSQRASELLVYNVGGLCVFVVLIILIETTFSRPKG